MQIAAGNTTAAVNNANVINGITSATWVGTAPNYATGATGNPAANTGVISTVNAQVFEDRVNSKILKILVGTLTPGQTNRIRLPQGQIGAYQNKKIIGIEDLGIWNPNAVETGNTPTASLIKLIGNWAVVKDAIIIEIAAANIDLYENKYIMLRVTIQA